MRSAASPSPAPPDGLEHAATDAMHLLAFHAPSHRTSWTARGVTVDSRSSIEGSSFEDCVNMPHNAAAANTGQQYGHRQQHLDNQLQQAQHHQQQQQQQAAFAEPPCPVLQAAEKAVSARLLPPLLLLVMVSYIDRTNLSFASIQLSRDLQLSSTMYGLGSGAFFLAYAVGQIPSNFLLLRFGGPTWLAAITLAWGAVASAFALVRGPVSFVLLRLALGLAESGALPGIWYYISLFYPAHKTTVPYSLIETGITVSQVIAAPFAAGLLMLDGVAGLRGWQWLFLLEGLPALALGCFIRVWLPASVATASFLPANQKEALSKALAAAAAGATAAPPPVPAATASGRDSSGTVLPACGGAVTAVPSMTTEVLAGEEDDIKVCIHDTLTSSPSSRSSSGGSGQLLGATAAAGSSGRSSGSSRKGPQQRWRHEQLEGRDVESDLDPHIKKLAAAAAAPGGAALPTVAIGGATLHSSSEADRGTEQQWLLDVGNINSTAYRAAAPAGEPAGCNSSQCTNPIHSSSLSSPSSCSSSSDKWQSLLAVAKNRVVLYAGCWRVLHDIPGSGTLYYTPMIVQALLLAAGSGGSVAGAAGRRSNNYTINNSSSYSSSSSDMNMASVLGNSSISSGGGGGGELHSSSAAAGPGVGVVLLSSIPYAAASLFHLVNAWHSQKHSERRWHIALTWLAGAAALLLLPLAAAGGLAAVSSGASRPAGPAAGPGLTPAAAVAAFVLLVVVHVGLNGANGLQTGLVAGSIVPREKALGLALYNTIGCIGAFWGPLVIGVLHDATGGFSVALLLLGVSLAAGAVMVVRFRPEQLDPRLTGARRV